MHGHPTRAGPDGSFATARQLVRTFSVGFDRRDVEVAVAPFSADMLWIQRVADGPWTRFEGLGEVRAMVRAMFVRHAEQRRRHLTTNLIGEANGPGHWRVRSFLTLLTLVPGGKPSLIATGTYEDDIERRGSEWLITRRLLTLDGVPVTID
ncbi:MAG: hypothetical protein CL484_15495 [Acidobacteria bacterium]|nr:hypothetical protein [Acidobacteriota bacterium]